MNGVPSHFRFRSRAFTLVELLVSLSILAITVVIFSKAIGGIAQAWRGAEDRMNNHSKARALLGRLGTDFSTIVERPDMAIFPQSQGGLEDNGELGFYTMRRGVDNSNSVETDTRALSYVSLSYDGRSARVIRKDHPYSYDNGSEEPLLGEVPQPSNDDTTPSNALPDRPDGPNTPTEVTLADGVLAFKWAFLRHDGLYSPNMDYLAKDPVTGVEKAYTAKGIVVAMAVMDDQAIKNFTDSYRRPITDIQSEFDYPDVQKETDPANWNPKVEWDKRLGLTPGSSGKIAQDFPIQFVRGIRTFQRVYLFPDNP